MSDELDMDNLERDQLKARVAALETVTSAVEASELEMERQLKTKTAQVEAQRLIVETYRSESKVKQREWSAGVDTNLSATSDDAREWAYAAGQILQRFDALDEAEAASETEGNRP